MTIPSANGATDADGEGPFPEVPSGKRPGAGGEITRGVDWLMGVRC